jgi:hypothetical protein
LGRLGRQEAVNQTNASKLLLIAMRATKTKP